MLAPVPDSAPAHERRRFARDPLFIALAHGSWAGSRLLSIEVAGSVAMREPLEIIEAAVFHLGINQRSFCLRESAVLGDIFQGDAFPTPAPGYPLPYQAEGEITMAVSFNPAAHELFRLSTDRC